MKVLIQFALIEALLSATCFNYVVAFVVLMSAIVSKTYQTDGIWIAIFASVDFYFVGWCIILDVIRISYIMMSNSVVLCSAFCMAYKSLTLQVLHSRNNRMKKYFLQTHSDVTKRVLQSGDENLSILIYSFLISNIPTSTFYLTCIVFGKGTAFFHLMMYLLVTMITAAFLVTLGPPALVNQASKGAVKHMPTLLHEIDSKNLCLKLKYMSYYEQLKSRKIGFKVGPFGTISINVICEVIIC